MHFRHFWEIRFRGIWVVPVAHLSLKLTSLKCCTKQMNTLPGCVAKTWNPNIENWISTRSQKSIFEVKTKIICPNLLWDIFDQVVHTILGDFERLVEKLPLGNWVNFAVLSHSRIRVSAICVVPLRYITRNWRIVSNRKTVCRFTNDSHSFHLRGRNPFRS